MHRVLITWDENVRLPERDCQQCQGLRISHASAQNRIKTITEKETERSSKHTRSHIPHLKTKHAISTVVKYCCIILLACWLSFHLNQMTQTSASSQLFGSAAFLREINWRGGKKNCSWFRNFLLRFFIFNACQTISQKTHYHCLQGIIGKESTGKWLLLFGHCSTPSKIFWVKK